MNVGGGEPFIREDFLDLLSYAHEKGIVTCVSTNRLLIDSWLARKLAKLDRFYLQVSLDGATEEINDAIRGKGTFRKILQALDCLAAEKVSFSLNTVLTRINYPQLEILRKLAAEYRAGLRVSRFRPSGRGRESKAILGPSSDQMEAFAEWLNAHDQVRTGDSFFCLTSENRRSKGLDMCGAAKMTCCVSPTGTVYPCAFLQDEVFKAGDVRTSSFKDLWIKAWIFEQFRELDVASCRTCRRFESCRGGCPAMASHTHGDISLPDPECFMNLNKNLTIRELAIGTPAIPLSIAELNNYV